MEYGKGFWLVICESGFYSHPSLRKAKAFAREVSAGGVPCKLAINSPHPIVWGHAKNGRVRLDISSPLVCSTGRSAQLDAARALRKYWR